MKLHSRIIYLLVLIFLSLNVVQGQDPQNIENVQSEQDEASAGACRPDVTVDIPNGPSDKEDADGESLFGLNRYWSAIREKIPEPLARVAEFTCGLACKEFKQATEEYNRVQLFPLHRLYMITKYLRYYAPLILKDPVSGFVVAGIHCALDTMIAIGSIKTVEGAVKALVEKYFPQFKDKVPLLINGLPMAASEGFKYYADPQGQLVGHLAFYVTQKLLSFIPKVENAPKTNMVINGAKTFVEWAALVAGLEFGPEVFYRTHLAGHESRAISNIIDGPNKTCNGLSEICDKKFNTWVRVMAHNPHDNPSAPHSLVLTYNQRRTAGELFSELGVREFKFEIAQDVQTGSFHFTHWVPNMGDVKETLDNFGDLLAKDPQNFVSIAFEAIGNVDRNKLADLIQSSKLFPFLTTSLDQYNKTIGENLANGTQAWLSIDHGDLKTLPFLSADYDKYGWQPPLGTWGLKETDFGHKLLGEFDCDSMSYRSALNPNDPETPIRMNQIGFFGFIPQYGRVYSSIFRDRVKKCMDYWGRPPVSISMDQVSIDALEYVEDINRGLVVPEALSEPVSPSNSTYAKRAIDLISSWVQILGSSAKTPRVRERAWR